MGDFGRWHRDIIHRYPRLSEEIPEGIISVFAKAHKAFDPGVDQHLGAEDAGSMGAVDGATFNADTVERGLNDAILLGMDGAANLVTGAGRNTQRVSEAAQFETVFQSGGSSIVTGGKDMLIPNGHRTDMVTEAGRALGHHQGDLEKVFIDTRTM